MTVKLNTKVIIIGAGPAGAGTSIFLTKAGIDHIILEKDIFPRDKICGDACTGKTMFVLRKANPEWYQELFERKGQFLPNHGLSFIAPNGKYLNIDFKVSGAKTSGFTSKRLDFDDFLFSKLPGKHNKIFQGVHIEAIKKSSGQVQVFFKKDGQDYEISGSFIVGADGDKGIVRKTFVGNDANSKSSGVGLRGYYSGITGLHQDKFIELHFLPELKPGYFWIFPLADGSANVGVGMLSGHIRKYNVNLRERMLNAIKNNSSIRERFASATLKGKIMGWGIPLYSKRSPVSGDNYILTGDAANLVDPFTGEGIGNALYSGMLAAMAIEKALKEKDHSKAFFKREYDDVLYKRLGQELKISLILQRFCSYSWLLNFIINKAHKSKTLGRTISSMFLDLDIRALLLKPSFYLKILFNK